MLTELVVIFLESGALYILVLLIFTKLKKWFIRTGMKLYLKAEIIIVAFYIYYKAVFSEIWNYDFAHCLHLNFVA